MAKVEHLFYDVLHFVWFLLCNLGGQWINNDRNGWRHY